MTDQSRATQPLQPDKSLGELFSDLTAETGRLVRQEMQLAKTEAREEIRRAGRGGAMLGGAALGAWLALLFASLALAWLLDQGMPRALAFLIVAVVWGVVAAILAARGKGEMKQVQPVPMTVDTLKEDVQWARTQKS
jgi:hypothetical protein